MAKSDCGFGVRQRGAMPKRRSSTEVSTEYATLLSSVSELLQRGRQNAAKSLNAVLTTTYWLVGRRLVEFEQRGKERAVYGSELLKRLSSDLQSQFVRGFSERNLEQMRQFYLQWSNRRNLLKDFADAVCEIEFERRTPVLAILVSLRATAVSNGSGSQAAL